MAEDPEIRAPRSKSNDPTIRARLERDAALTPKERFFKALRLGLQQRELANLRRDSGPDT